MKNLNIYLDRLKDCKELAIEEIIPSNLLLPQEKELQFDSHIHLKGKAYLANEHLCLELAIETKAHLPCSICNELKPHPISIPHFRHLAEKSEGRGAIYNYAEELRHIILLQIPTFFECSGGTCPSRNEVQKLIESEKENTSNPFSGLDGRY